MSAYKNILVAIDISTEADGVLKTALDIAKTYEAKIQVIHVIEPMANFYNISPEYYSPMTEDIIRENAFINLQTKLEKMDLSSECLSITVGNPGDEIIRQAEDLQSDLIIVGSHGRRGIRLLLGSTANSVMHHAKCDVLAVRIHPSKHKD